MVSFLPQDLPETDPPKGGLHLLEQRLMQLQVILDSLKEWCANEQAQQAAPQPYIHTSSPQPGSPYVPPDTAAATPDPNQATEAQCRYITGLIAKCWGHGIDPGAPFGRPEEWNMTKNEASQVIGRMKDALKERGVNA